MLFTTTEYRITDVFCGLIWKGWAVVGLDLDSDAWGVVAGPFYAGWTWQ